MSHLTAVKHDELHDVSCSVARTWAIPGDPRRAVDDDDPARVLPRGAAPRRFRTKLGLGSNVLDDRLQVLVAEGSSSGCSTRSDPRGHEYKLTQHEADRSAP